MTMKLLGKKRNTVEMSIEAYACNCADCDMCGGECTCARELRNTVWVRDYLPQAIGRNNNAYNANYIK